MIIVNSISSPEKVFETSGSQPILILGNDLNFYVCKYNRWSGSEAKKLFNELIAACFAQKWNLSVPSFNFVKVDPTHIENIAKLQPSFFSTLCFGSLYNSKFSEIDEFYSEISNYDKRRFENKIDFLKIALFDIWLANEDRNFNNYNLLIDIENGNKFVPIDHDAIFNTGNLDKGLVLLSNNETLINTDLAKKLFTKNELCGKDYFKNIRDDYYICIKECEKNIDNILGLVPEDWKININEYRNLFNLNLFSKKWVDDCINHFFELVQIEF